MRKLLWFTLGFALAVGLGSYVLTPGVYFYVSGGCALVLAACLFVILVIFAISVFVLIGKRSTCITLNTAYTFAFAQVAGKALAQQIGAYDFIINLYHGL